MGFNVPKDYVKIATKYAKDVVSEKILTSKLTIASCQRQLDDLKRQGDDDFPYIFNPQLTDRNGIKYKPADRFCSFVELHSHTKGKLAGQKFSFEPWQHFIFTTVFGWIHKDTGLRRFSESYLEVCRGNGKSPMGAVTGHYMLTADLDKGAEVYSGATTRAQALEVFGPSWIMARKNKQYRDKYNLRVWGEKADFGAITSTAENSKFIPLVGNPPDGASVSCYICDEYHEHPSDSQYSTMETGCIKREQPLIFVITTAGSNIGGPCYLHRTQVINVLNKAEGFENESLFGIIYTLDNEHDWTDLENWPRANPNWGISVVPDKAAQILKNALQKPSKQNITKTKHLNIWCNVASAYYDMESLKKCVDKSLKYEDFHTKDCINGNDLASKTDLTSSVDVFWDIIDGVKHYWAFTFPYMPEDALEGEDNRHYQGWATEGYLNIIPGASINTDYIESDIKDRSKQVNMVENTYDPWNAATMVAHMEDDGFTMVEIGQTVANMTEPTKELDSAIRDGRFHYDGNPVLTWCLSNVVCQADTNDNVKPKRAKGQDHMKIDCAIALIMAVGRAMVHKPKKKGNDGSLLNIQIN